MDLYIELLMVCKQLEQESIDYTVCGGFALAVHGHPRFASEIELLVHAEDLQRVAKFAGNDICHLNFLVAESGYEWILSNRKPYDYDGSLFCVVSRDGLITMKQLAGGGQDLLDIQYVTSVKNILDMSPEAVHRRLREVTELQALGLIVMKFKPRLETEPTQVRPASEPADQVINCPDEPS